MTIALLVNTPVKALGLSNRSFHALENNGIATVGDAVRRHKTLHIAPGVGRSAVRQLEDVLSARALSNVRPMDELQLNSLCLVSGSKDFAFDIFGRLIGVSSRQLAVRPIVNVIRNHGLQEHIVDLPIPVRLKKALLQAGYRRTSEAARLTDDELMQLHGVGTKAVEAFRAVLAYAHVPLAPCTLPQTILEGVQLAFDVCDGKGLPVYREAFCASMPYLLLSRLGGEQDVATYRDAAIDVAEDANDASNACASALATKLFVMREEETIWSPGISIPIAPQSPWELGARLLAGEDSQCIYFPYEHELRARRLRLSEWLEGNVSNPRDLRVLRMYLNGKTMEECGQVLGITRERVRQIVTRELRRAPILYENRYRHFYATYKLSKADFMRFTGEPSGTFVYLRTTYEKTNTAPRSLAHAVSDDLVPLSARERVRNYLDEGYVYAGGIRVRLTRLSIIDYVGMSVSVINGEVDQAKRDQILRDFHERRLRVLITNPQTLAESVSLHDACHDAVYFEYGYNLVHLLQSKDRIHRLGLERDQYTQYFFIQTIFDLGGQPWSLDANIYARLREKEEQMLSAIDQGVLEEGTTDAQDLEAVLGNLFNSNDENAH